MSHLKDRFDRLKKQCDKACLVAVSKQASLEQIKILIDHGHKDFGENRVDQLFDRAQYFKNEDIRWHFIGNLQSNKLKKLFEVPSLFAIHSIDRLSLLKKILEFKEPPNLFLQMKTSHEAEKAGFILGTEFDEALVLLSEAHIELYGLMTMAPIRDPNLEAAAKRSFEQLSNLRAKLNPMLKLSMGMSSDYLLALDSGSDYVRIGSSLFQD